MVKNAGLEGSEYATPMWPVLNGGPQNLVDEMKVISDHVRNVRSRLAD